MTLNYSTAAETITVSDAGSGQTSVDSNVAGETLTFNNPTGVLTINAGDTGANTINVGALANPFPASLHMNGGTGGDTVNLNGALTLAANKSLSVDAMTINAPYIDSDIAASGTGSVELTATKNIELAYDSSITTVDGALRLEANGAGNAVGNFVGIRVYGRVQTTGAGTLHLDGTGGGPGVNWSGGVRVEYGGQVIGGDGFVSVTGRAGSGQNSWSAEGVAVDGAITATGSGAVSVIGIGGSGVTTNSHGVVVWGGTITSGGGNVTVTGMGGSAVGDSSSGVHLSYGGTITSGGSGTTSVTGTGGSGGGSCHGVSVSWGEVTSGGGDVSVTGIVSGNGMSDTAVVVDAGQTVSTAANGGRITVIGNSMHFAGTVTAGSSGTVTLRQYTAGTAIDLGGADGADVLGLDSEELNQITAGTLTIGRTDGGDVVVTAGISPAHVTTLHVVSGGTIGDSNVTSTDLQAPNVVLDGAVAPGTSPGILAIAGDLVLADDSTFPTELGGTTAGEGDDRHDQLAVTGTVTIGSGVALQVTPWQGYTPSVGGSYTILDNDGTEAVSGTFDGLDEGAELTVGGVTLRITYAGGSDGNDVVLVVVSPPSTVYVDDDWATYTAGTVITDADPVADGDQAAVYGINAFSGNAAGFAFADALAAVISGGTVIVNAGDYGTQAVNLDKPVTMNLQQGAIRFGSLDDSVTDAALNLNGIALTTGGNGGSTQFDSPIGGTGGLSKTGTGTLTLLGNNTYTGSTEVRQGVLLVNGAIGTDGSDVTVFDGALLGGDGTIGPTPGGRDVLVQTGGVLNPGRIDVDGTRRPGRLTVNGDVTFQAGAVYQVQVQGLEAAAQYDQLKVNGTVDLAGLLTGASGAVLDLSLGYAPLWGSCWRIIDNNLDDQIETRFQGLVDGAWPVVGGMLMNIAYRAGDASNDVVLTIPGMFDFGGPATAADYNSVSLPQWYVDTAAQDVGWATGAGPLASFDRGLADALRSDGHYGYDGTLLADLPVTADYVVTPVIGDAAPFYHDLLEVTAEGAAAPQLKLTTQPGQWGAPSFVVSSDTQLSLRLRDAGGVDPHYVINGLRLRPREAANTILIAPPSANAALDADGMTVDTYTGTRAPFQSLVTVATTLGTLVAADDVDPTWQGIQVQTDDAGAFTFHILRPSGLSTNPQTAVISAQEIEGRALGQGAQEFQSAHSGGDDATVMRFDFNASATYTQLNPDFLPVGPRDLYNATRGYGWSVRVAAADRPSSGFSNLNRDLHTGSNASFRVQVETGTTYNVRVHLANPLGTGGYRYTYDNFDVLVEGGTTGHIDLLPAGEITILTLSGTDAGPTADGILDIQFVDRGGQNFNWVVSGLELSTGSLGNFVEYLVTEAVAAAEEERGVTIDNAALAPVVAEAAARWSAAGLTPAQAAVLADLHVGVADLGGAALGAAYPTTRDVRIDDDAAGWGWDVERSAVSGQRSASGGSLFLNPEARALNPASGILNPGLDLLATVMHEIGHLLGYEHEEDGLMAPVLSASKLRPSAFSPRPSTLGSRLWTLDSKLWTLGSSAEAVEPLGQAQWRTARDDVFTDLGRDDRDGPLGLR